MKHFLIVFLMLSFYCFFHGLFYEENILFHLKHFPSNKVWCCLLVLQSMVDSYCFRTNRLQILLEIWAFYQPLSSTIIFYTYFIKRMSS